MMGTILYVFIYFCHENLLNLIWSFCLAFPHFPVCKEEESNSSLVREEPQPLQIKEEQEQLLQEEAELLQEEAEGVC